MFLFECSHFDVFRPPKREAQTKKRGWKLRSSDGPASKFRSPEPPNGTHSDRKGGPKRVPFRVLRNDKGPGLAGHPVLFHTIASVGKLELEQTSLMKFIFQITNVVELEILLNSNSFGFRLFKDTTVRLITLYKVPLDFATDGSSPVAGILHGYCCWDCFAQGLSRLTRPKVLLPLFKMMFVLVFALGFLQPSEETKKQMLRKKLRLRR